MLDKARPRAFEHRRILVEDQLIDAGRGKRIGGRGIVVGIADHQRAVGAAHDDEVDAVAQMLALLGQQPSLSAAAAGRSA